MNYNNMEGPKLELKLNLSPPRRGSSSSSSSPRTSSVSSMEIELSPPASSCVSREPSPEDEYPSSPETTTSMMLVGCPRCLMYVMLADEDPKCPKCKSTVLLDFFQEERTMNNNKSTK